MPAMPRYNTVVEQGAVYKRASSGSMMETAEVLEVAKDKMGIPHVRFELRVICGGNSGSVAEQRTLALDTFYAKYRERVAS